MKKIDKFFCIAFLAGTIYFALYNISTRLFIFEIQIIEILYKAALITILLSAGWCLGKGISPYKVMAPIKGATPKEDSGAL
jgi:hypothetical protein